MLASVRRPTVRASFPRPACELWPSSVNTTPDSSGTGSISRRPMATTRSGVTASVCSPERLENAAYVSTTQAPATSSVGRRKWPAAGSERSQAEPTRPPAPMPSSTTASMITKLKLVPTMNRLRKRNHTTSSAKSAAPHTNAAPSKRHGTPGGSLTLSSAGAVPASTGARERTSAMHAATRLKAPATSAVPRMPSAPTSSISPRIAPHIAPSVFQP